MRQDATVLDPRQQEALAALLAGKTPREAAGVADVAASTVYRWMKLETFQDALRQGLKGTLAAAMDRLKQRASDLVDVVTELATDPKTPAQTRLTAATKGIGLVLRYEERELGERLEELERQLDRIREDWVRGNSA